MWPAQVQESLIHAADNLDSSTKFGLEGGVGADLEISPRFAIFVERRYHNVFTEDENFQILTSVGGPIGIGTR